MEKGGGNMISDLNLQQGSKNFSNYRHWTLGLLLSLALCLIMFPAHAEAKQPAPLLRTTAGFQPNLQESDWLTEDSLWLGQQLLGIAPVMTGDALNPESLVMWRQWVQRSATVTPDSMLVARSVSSQLRDRWLRRGYFSASVGVHFATADSALAEVLPDTLVLDPGSPYRLGNMDISGDDFEGRDHLIQTWLPRPGELFRPGDFDAGINQILEGAGDIGFPFARWATSKLNLDEASSELHVKASLLPGTESYIGPLSCDLPDGRGKKFLLKASGLSPGERFRNSDLERARQRLWVRELYTEVGMPQVYMTTARDTVGIHFPVKPRQRVNHLQVVLGLSRPSDDSGSKVSGEVDLRLPNMAGTGRSLQVGWRDDGVKKSRFGFNYLEPLAFGTPLDAELALSHEVEDESFTLFSLDNRWRLQVVPLWGVELGVGWDRSTYPIGPWVSSNRTRARGAFFHRRGDRTRSGWSGLFAIENAWRSTTGRIEEDESGGTDINSDQSLLGESVTQQIYEVDTAGELFLTQTWSLFARASFRELSGNLGEVPLSEQFHFGGASTLRGFRENEFHGSRAAWSSIEVRVGRPGGSRLYSFYDLGYFAFSAADPLVDDPAQRILKEGWPKGFGLGILAKTPAGDISLAMGFPGTVDFDQAKLHVTLLESF
jgi:outer membrane protein assembly factor BamA